MENFRIESLEINKIGAFEHIKMDFPVKNTNNKFHKYSGGGKKRYVVANNHLKTEYINKRTLELKGIEQEYDLAFFACSGFRKSIVSF